MVGPVYVERASRADIPSDAVILSRSDVISMHFKTIYAWSPQTDIWPFRYGLMGLSGLSAVSTIVITNHYRNKLKLLSYGRLPMYLPTVFFPSAMAILLHRNVISSSVMLQEGCPVCIQVRGMLLQCGLSVFYPMILAPISGFYYAMTSGSYNVPPLQRQYIPELFKLWWNMTRKLKSTFPVLLGLNAIMSSAITYLEAVSFFKVQQKIYEKEEQLRNKVMGRDNVTN